jgi:type II secretory pathway pseudopilin PulG
MTGRIDSRRAFTLLELMVIATVMCVLLALLIPATVKGIAKQKRIGCVSRLKDMGLSYRIFATDNHDLFPWQLITNAPPAKTFDDALRHYLAISNELSTPKILVCPSDTRKAAADWVSLSRTNLSYFVSLDSAETYPRSILVGDRNVTTNGVRIGSGIVDMAGQTNVAWDGAMHRFQGNAAMGDGSVQQLSVARFREQMRNSGQASSKWAVP